MKNVNIDSKVDIFCEEISLRHTTRWLTSQIYSEEFYRKQAVLDVKLEIFAKFFAFRCFMMIVTRNLQNE